MPLELPTPSPAPFKNRRGWLIAFGVIQILIGSFCVLVLAVMVLGLLIGLIRANRPTQSPEITGAVAVMAVLVYGGLGAVFLILGVGSIKCKNWARIGTQIVSGFWLFTGILAGLFLAFILPSTFEQQGKIPPEQQRLGLIFLGVFMALFMVIVPAILLVFYSLRSVRATCLASGLGQTPTTATTEHVAATPPGWVIALAVWEGFGVLGVFSLLAVRGNVIFGIVVHGPGAVILMTTHAALSLIAAWLIYRRDFLGWEISLFKLLFWAASWAVTLLRRDLLEVYQEIGLSAQQLQLFRQQHHLPAMVGVLTLGGFVPLLLLLLYTKKYFSRRGAGAGPTGAGPDLPNSPLS